MTLEDITRLLKRITTLVQEGGNSVVSFTPGEQEVARGLLALIEQYGEAARAVVGEIRYQNRKWPDHDHVPCEWITILRRQVSNAESVWYDTHDPESMDVMDEIRQVAAVAVQALSQCGSPQRKV